VGVKQLSLVASFNHVPSPSFSISLEGSTIPAVDKRIFCVIVGTASFAKEWCHGKPAETKKQSHLHRKKEIILYIRICGE